MCLRCRCAARLTSWGPVTRCRQISSPRWPPGRRCAKPWNSRTWPRPSWCINSARRAAPRWRNCGNWGSATGKRSSRVINAKTPFLSGVGVGRSSAAIATARSGTMSKRLTIEQMHIFAERFGGRCISTEYATNSTKLHWECKAGHQWLAVPATVRRGMWCPFCSGNARLTIEAMHHLAREHGGLCLSETYVNTTTALLWQCAAGHQFKVPPKIIRRGHSVPKCGGSYPLNLEEMQALAVRRGGKCLSPEIRQRRHEINVAMRGRAHLARDTHARQARPMV